MARSDGSCRRCRAARGLQRPCVPGTPPRAGLLLASQTQPACRPPLSCKNLCSAVEECFHAQSRMNVTAMQPHTPLHTHSLYRLLTSLDFRTLNKFFTLATRRWRRVWGWRAGRAQRRWTCTAWARPRRARRCCARSGPCSSARARASRRPPRSPSSLVRPVELSPGSAWAERRVAGCRNRLII